MKKQLFEQQSHFKLIVILLFVAYFILMYGNNVISLTHPDEVFYIQSAKEMVAHHKWFTPMIFDNVQFEKPFFSFALFAFAIKFFGMTPFVARFWPAFFGILGVGVTYWISWLLFGKKRQSFISAFIICTSFIYLALSRAVLTDMIFSVLVATSIGFYYLGYSREKYRNSGILFGFAFTAIAVLTKGLLGFFFPWTTIFIFLVYKKDLKFILKPVFLWGFLLFLLLAVPWHIAMYKAHGRWFLEEYFYNVHFRRVLQSEHPKIDNWYFYFGLMFAGVLPWSFFWFPAIRKTYMQFKNKEEPRDKLFFILGWIFSIFIFVQPAHCKLASYIFPVFPAIAILFGFYINSSLEAFDRGEKPLGLKICAYLVSTVLVGIVIAAYVVRGKYAHLLIDMAPVYYASFLMLIAASILFVLNKKKKYTSLVLSFMSINVALLVLLFFIRPSIETWVSCKDISKKFVTIDHSNSVVLASKFYVRGVRYYTDRKMAVIDINGKGFWSPHPIPYLNTDQKLLDFLNSQETTYAIVKENNMNDIYRITTGHLFKVKNLGGFGGKFILRIDKI